MLPYYWPCHMRREDDGSYRVMPFDVQECVVPGPPSRKPRRMPRRLYRMRSCAE